MVFIQCLLAFYVGLFSVIGALMFIYNKYKEKKLKGVKPPNFKRKEKSKK